MRAVAAAFLLVLICAFGGQHVEAWSGEGGSPPTCGGSVSLDGILEVVESILRLTSGQGSINVVLKSVFHLIGIDVKGSTTQDFLANIPVVGSIIKTVLDVVANLLKGIPVVGTAVGGTLGISARSHVAHMYGHPHQ